MRVCPQDKCKHEHSSTDPGLATAKGTPVSSRRAGWLSTVTPPPNATRMPAMVRRHGRVRRRALDRRGVQIRCDGVDDGRAVDGNGALAPGEVGASDGVMEQGGQHNPGQEAPRCELIATKLKDDPEQSRSQGA